jgi:23S rRNA (cytidine1920-2'-O)/16S rRNA (cytidine1409-2'-O)-methyltransferase
MSTKPLRLDAELVRRRLYPSRTEARRAIESGAVAVRGLRVTKPASLVAPEASITIEGPPPRFASRGGDKLDGALARFDVEVEGLRWLDAGASTGGFTDRLLAGRAAAVAAVDVGYGQLDFRLRTDDRVVVLERTNVRRLTLADLPWRPQGVVADLSFISLTLVLPALATVAEEDADHVLLVKPQFEVGRDAVGRGGVVHSPELWRGALESVVRTAERAGLGLEDACRSPLLGPAGNTEFFVHLRHGGAKGGEVLDAAVREASG